MAATLGVSGSIEMWIIVVGFGLSTLLVAWLLFGYVVWLRFTGDALSSTEVRPSESFPSLSIVVPCLNEADLILDKYQNLRNASYPKDRASIVFADGGSSDGTIALLETIAHDDDNVKVISCPVGGKINQLNHVLPMLHGEIVVVTDADAIMAPDALVWLVGEFEADQDMAVVGAYSSPRGGLDVERCYWTAQNRVRLLESRISHVSMVMACCYAFRRDLLDRFPSDVVADDVYIAALANTLGYHTAYSAKACVEELRVPTRLPEFFRHKFRKGNAVLREYLRFSYRLPEMESRWKSILSTRIVQQLLLPWGTMLWLTLTATLLNLGQFDVPCLGAAVLLVGLLATRKATMSVEPPVSTERFGVVTLTLAYVYTMAVLCANALTYASFRQSSCYSRLSSAPRRAARDSVEKKMRTATEMFPSIPGVQEPRAALGLNH